jgi:biotin synthase-like enzyme
MSAAGLDYYNHNIDTSERYYPKVVSTPIPTGSRRWKTSGNPA